MRVRAAGGEREGERGQRQARGLGAASGRRERVQRRSAVSARAVSGEGSQQ